METFLVKLFVYRKLWCNSNLRFKGASSMHISPRHGIIISLGRHGDMFLVKTTGSTSIGEELQGPWTFKV